MPNDTASARHRPAIAFMRDGEHGTRYFCDPQGKILRPVQTHRVGTSWIQCPDSLREKNPTGTYPVCDLCILATKDWRLRREPLVLLYGVLIRTSNPSPYWRPGRTYLMIAPDTLLACLAQLIKQGSPQQRKLFYTMADPKLPGPAMVVTVKKGRPGSVTFNSFTAENLPPVTLGEWYLPFREGWSGAQCNLAAYEALVAQVTRSNRSTTDQEHMRTEQEDSDKSDNTR